MPAAATFTPRLSLLQKNLSSTQGILVTDPHDITYFSGFMTLVPEEREAFLVVTKKQAYLLYTSFSPLPVTLEVEALTGTAPSQVAQHLQFITKKTGLQELLVDKTRLFVAEFEALQTATDLKLETLDKKWLWSLRQVKDGVELEKIIIAGKLAAQAYERIISEVKVGISEQELQLLLEAEMRRLGSEQPAFPTIVAFGTHTALPHHQPSRDTLLEDNMAVLFDFGATVGGYRSDITRSFWFGSKPDPKYLQIKNTVDEAYAKVLEFYAHKTGQKETVTAADLDTAARDFIGQAGYGEYFIHTTGHGVGLDIHEPPSLSAKNIQPLAINTVITIEPGIYLPDTFGYRHENTVLVTENELAEITLP